MKFTLAWRNIWRNPKRTLITVSSILFAVFFSVFMASMNRGQHHMIVGTTCEFHMGYMQVQDSLFRDEPSLDNAMFADETLIEALYSADPAIGYVLPRIETFMLASGAGQARVAMIMGVDFEKEHQFNGIYDRIRHGSVQPDGSGTAVLGEGLAGRLQVSVGDTIVLMGQGRFGQSAAGLFPVSAIIRHPLIDLNNQLVYLGIGDAQRLLSAEDHFTALIINPSEIRHIDRIAGEISRILPAVQPEEYPLAVYTWRELMPELHRAIQFDVANQYFLAGILYVVIMFGLFGTVLMMTLERRREFGVLLSVGMRRSRLMGVVALETLFICLMGVVAGLIISLPILIHFFNNPIPLTGDMAEVMLEMGFEPFMPFALDPDLFFTQAAIIFVIALIVGLYQVRKIQTLEILDASKG